MASRHHIDGETMIDFAVWPTAALFGAAVLLAACQGPGDRSAGSEESVKRSYGYVTTCNGPCYGFHRRRGGMGPH